MPVVRFRVKELQQLLGKKVPQDKLLATIPMLGADVDKAEGEEWAVEFFPDRPDLYSVEGIARALRAYLGTQPGLATYKVAKGKEALRVDPSVKKVRPVIRGAVVKGLRFTDARIQGIMELQEDLHHGVGARRRKASIGVHDKRRLVPPYTYKAVGLDEVAFVPLQGTEELSPGDILAKHPKGQAFAHLVGERAPLLVDSKGQVLSFPPIINGTLTTVTGSTTDVLVDVTGLDERAVEKALNLVVTHLAEQGGKVESLTVQEGSRKLVRPDLAPERWAAKPAHVNQLLGLALTPPQMVQALKRMGMGARVAQGKLVVDVPCYRTDILHEVDLVEDVAIGHGYANFPYEKPRAVTYGRPLEVEQRGARAREVLFGLGFTEVMTLSLTSDAIEGDALGLPARPAVRLQNPITKDHTTLRTTLLGSLLALLQKNVHRDYPQQVFEVGDVVWWHGEGMPANRRLASWVRAHSRASFSEAKSVALALARDLKLSAEVTPLPEGDPFAKVFLPGRAAMVGEWGWFGELHPRTLDAFGIGQPTIAMESILGERDLAEA